jgi:hypothetical protein
MFLPALQMRLAAWPAQADGTPGALPQLESRGARQHQRERMRAVGGPDRHRWYTVSRKEQSGAD